jgi:DNA helicase-2/ATP-dependent DNA helicase PcrA
VVGVDAQSIYGFRQADIRNILEFETHFPKAKVILLEQNYRSTQTILDAAHAIIENNVNQKKKKLWTANAGGERVFYYQAYDADTEARFVASKIEEYQRRSSGERVAVLYRTNAQSRVFEESLRRLRIDYNIVGGFSFYERAEIKDIVAYVKLALNPFDDIALQRVINTPPRGLGKTSLDELQDQARRRSASLWMTIATITDRGHNEPVNLTPRAKESFRAFRKTIEHLVEKVNAAAYSEKPVSDVVIAAIEDTGYANMLRLEGTDESEARLENLEELVNAAVDYDNQREDGLREFIDHAALTSDTDKYDRNAGVTLMTVHSAKGLEFPTVFLVGLEDGIFPHSRSINDPKELEEERRLAYVAITRAERVLYVSHSMRRRVYGDDIASEPSQFLNELPLELIEDISPGPSWLSYARGSGANANRSAASALRGESYSPPKKKNLYTGQTYNSAEAISDFFKKRGSEPARNDEAEKPSPTLTTFERLKAAGTPKSNSQKAEALSGFVPGSHVTHEKYGRGLVLRREGSGDNVKLTISFPGYGQKKLIEKFANLQKA